MSKSLVPVYILQIDIERESKQELFTVPVHKTTCECCVKDPGSLHDHELPRDLQPIEMDEIQMMLLDKSGRQPVLLFNHETQIPFRWESAEELNLLSEFSYNCCFECETENKHKASCRTWRHGSARLEVILAVFL